MAALRKVVGAARAHAHGVESAGTEQWWDEVLAGEVAARHPIYGDDLKVKLTDGKLVLSGEVPSKRDRDQLVREARARIGSGLHEYDVSGLKIRPRDEKPGLLEQSMVAAYGHRDTADLARKYFLEHSRSRPMRADILDGRSNLDASLPSEVVDQARKQLELGRTLLVVGVDETEAFRARALLEEDTQSSWTVAAPPHVIANGRSR